MSGWQLMEREPPREPGMYWCELYPSKRANLPDRPIALDAVHWDGLTWHTDTITRVHQYWGPLPEPAEAQA